MSQALTGQDLTVLGDGSQTRSFCYVDDLVEGIYRLLLSDYHLPVNIGNPAGDHPAAICTRRSLNLQAPIRRSYSIPLPTDDPEATETGYHQGASNYWAGNRKWTARKD